MTVGLDRFYTLLGGFRGVRAKTLGGRGIQAEGGGYRGKGVGRWGGGRGEEEVPPTEHYQETKVGSPHAPLRTPKSGGLK